ncbi:MAG: choice-of-anchor D domain-containing protein [Terriglobales bacterium]
MTYLADGLRHTVPGDYSAERLATASETAPWQPPGCHHLAWDGNIIYTTHRRLVDKPTFLAAWDISPPDPANPGKLAPVQFPVLQEPGISYEGIDVANGNIYVGLHGNGLGVYRRYGKRIRRIGTASGLTDAWGVRARDNTVFVADGRGGLAIVDAKQPRAPKLVGKVEIGGLARGVVVEGKYAYVAAGTAGVAVVDISDLSSPKVVNKVPVPGTAVRMAYSNTRIYVAAWNDVRAYDVSNPASPRYIGSVRLENAARFGASDEKTFGAKNFGITEEESAADLPVITMRSLSVAAHEDVVFVGNWMTPYSYRIFPERSAPSLLLPESASMVDFGPVTPGHSKTISVDVSNQSMSVPLTVYDIRAEGKSFSVEPKTINIAPGSTATLSVTFRPATSNAEVGTVKLSSDDPSEPSRVLRLRGNRGGAGVGKPLPETRVQLLDGSEWSSNQNRGKVMLLAYFATF